MKKYKLSNSAENNTVNKNSAHEEPQAQIIAVPWHQGRENR